MSVVGFKTNHIPLKYMIGVLIRKVTQIKGGLPYLQYALLPFLVSTVAAETSIPGSTP